MDEDPFDYCNIAHNTIQDRRAQTPVPCEPGDNLHDYVPFYFAPRSPMLYAVHMGNVADCTARQIDIVYLVSSAENVSESNLEFVFTDGHGIVAFSDFYNDLDDLSMIDWDIMKEQYWADTDDDPDRKRRRQAEFLVHKKFPWKNIEFIAVISLFEIAIVNRPVIERALASKIKNFEDAVLNEAGQMAGANFIITRNTKDFSRSSLKVCDPNEFLALLA